MCRVAYIHMHNQGLEARLSFFICSESRGKKQPPRIGEKLHRARVETICPIIQNAFILYRKRIGENA